MSCSRGSWSKLTGLARVVLRGLSKSQNETLDSASQLPRSDRCHTGSALDKQEAPIGSTLIKIERDKPLERFVTYSLLSIIHIKNRNDIQRASPHKAYQNLFWTTHLYIKKIGYPIYYPAVERISVERCKQVVDWHVGLNCFVQTPKSSLGITSWLHQQVRVRYLPTS